MAPVILYGLCWSLSTEHRCVVKFRAWGIEVHWETVWSNLHLWHFIRPVRDTNWLIAKHLNAWYQMLVSRVVPNHPTSSQSFWVPIGSSRSPLHSPASLISSAIVYGLPKIDIGAMGSPRSIFFQSNLCCNSFLKLEEPSKSEELFMIKA